MNANSREFCRKRLRASRVWRADAGGWFLFPGLAALFCLLAAGALKAASGQQEPPPTTANDSRTFALASRFAKETVLRYQTQGNLTMRFQGAKNAEEGLIPSALDVTYRYKARELRPDGAVVMTMLSTGGTVLDASNSVLAIPKDPENLNRVATLDRNQKLLELKDPARSTPQGSPTDGLLSQSNLLIQLHFLPLPDKPVRVGDRWTVRYPLPGAKDEKRAAESAESGRGGKAEEEDLSAARVEMTLLGVEKIGDIETLKVRQKLSIPDERPVDAQGRGTTKEKAKGRIRVLLTFDQTANLLPQEGLLIRSVGQVGGWVRFEGAIARLVPGDMTIEGRIAVVLRPDEDTK
jgi:hypothetical protein